MQYPLDGNSIQQQSPAFEKGKFYICKEARSSCFTAGKLYLCCEYSKMVFLVNSQGELTRTHCIESKFIPA